MPEKHKLLWISDSPRLAYIGQSIVTREVLNRFDQNIWDITVLGFGDDKIKNPIDLPYKIISCGRTEMKDVQEVSKHIQSVKPEVVLVSHDIFMFPAVAQIKQAAPHIKFVGYITVDGVPIFSGWRPYYYAYDLIIVPTEWGKRQLLAQWLDLDVEVVPYGLDHDVFRPPTTSREELKASIEQGSQANPYNKRLMVTDKFVGIYYGANQTRKNLGAIYYGWKKFAQDKDDVRFFLLTHSAMLAQYVGSYSLGPFTDANGMEIIPNEVPQDWLVRFVGMSDVLLHPSSGEGFGMTMLEAMGCGTVPIVCDYSAHTDFCNDQTSYIVKWNPFVGQFNVIRAIADHDDVAAQLQRAYFDWKSGVIETKRRACIQMAKKYTWERTAEELSTQLLSLLESTEKRLVLKHIL